MTRYAKKQLTAEFAEENVRRGPQRNIINIKLRHSA